MKKEHRLLRNIDKGALIGILMALSFIAGTFSVAAQWEDYTADMGIGIIAGKEIGMNVSFDVKAEERFSLGGEFGFIGYTGPAAEGYHTRSGCSGYSCWANTTYSDGTGYGEGGYFAGARFGTPFNSKMILTTAIGAYWWKKWYGYLVEERTQTYARVGLKRMTDSFISYEVGGGTQGGYLAVTINF